MRLKYIKLAGFKSFVDPTSVIFPGNLTAIVGPNGCGKSNVIDAVRWVMGESSAKNLRGESMADVIFNGSNTRKPTAQASIELVFENHEGRLGGEYAAYNELAIRRQVTRDGQSVYFLNGTKCRRKDITDIFLGTGLGPRSYAIIEQGMISRLIDAKPDELRIFIEEAAGISKYKERRRETELRIRHTRDNLDRLTDLREELERQLESLKRQAQTAEKYTQYKQEERATKAKLLAVKWRHLDQQSQQIATQIRALELQIEADVTDRVAAETATETLRVEYQQAQDQHQSVQARYYERGGEIARLEQQIQHHHQRRQQLQEELNQTQTQLVQVLSHQQQDDQQAQQLSMALDRLAPELLICTENAELSQAQLAEVEEALQVWQYSWDDFQQQAMQPREIAQVQQSNIQHLENSEQRLRERLQKLQQEKTSLMAQQQTDTSHQDESQLNELAAALEQVQQHYQETNQQLTELRERLRTHQQVIDQHKEQLQANKGRESALRALQEAALKQDDPLLTQWLAEQQLHNKTTLAQQLKVDAGWNASVEWVLGQSLHALCLETQDVHWQSALAQLSSGELNLLQLPQAATQAAIQSSELALKLPLLMKKIQTSLDLSSLLDHIYIADHWEQAFALQSQLAVHESIVTIDGIWLGRYWIKINKGQDPASGLLHRQALLEQLSADIILQQATLHECSAQQILQQEQLQQLEQQREQWRAQLSQMQAEQGEVKSRWRAQQAKAEQQAARQTNVIRELNDCEQQLALEYEQLAQARLTLQTALESMAEIERIREQKQQAREQLRQQLTERKSKAQQDRDALHLSALQEKQLHTQQAALQQSLSRLNQQAGDLQLRVSTLQEQQRQAAATMQSDDALEAHLQQLLDARAQLETSLMTARQIVQDIEHRMREQEGRRHRADAAVQTARVQLEQVRLDNQTMTVRRATLQEQLLEMEVELTTLLAELTEQEDESTWEQALARITARIERLGPVNLVAIEEYNTQQERKVYLDTQNADLVEALETLETAIRKIDRETRQRFKETFDQVNIGMQTLFPKIFGGGRAYLELTGEDILDTGVTIMAQPPGKRNSTIHLLSGGEKALTAISLVFSIFQLNPAPFCLLDEVDAPLDDANVGRFCRLVEEMSKKVQFIYITHNKIAMEMAHHLMGVTMHEAGVSRLVAVDVEAAAALAEA